MDETPSVCIANNNAAWIGSRIPTALRWYTVTTNSCVKLIFLFLSLSLSLSLALSLSLSHSVPHSLTQSHIHSVLEREGEVCGL